MEYQYLLTLCIIVVSTKLFGLASGRIQLPQVVGALVAGLIIGPACFNFVQPGEFFDHIAEIGVIVIMFSAGLETSIDDIKKSGKSSIFVAVIGVLVPLGLGTLLTMFFNESGNIWESIFIGTILTATSVSITVETLKEMGKLSTKVGNTILTAALLDDVIGLICLTVVTSLSPKQPDANGVIPENPDITIVLLKIVGFFVFITIFGIVAHMFFKWYEKRVGNRDLHRFPIVAFAMCLFLAWAGEAIFGVADIIGAFSAGLIMSTTNKGHYCETKMAPVQYIFLAPVFFANIGLKVVIPPMSPEIILFSVLLVLVALISKVIGCGAGGMMSGFNTKQSLQIGIGMACRGEVALIVADKGVAMGIVPEVFFAPIVIMIVVCTILTPVLLKLAFKGENAPDNYDSSRADFIERKAEAEAFASEIMKDEI